MNHHRAIVQACTAAILTLTATWAAAADTQNLSVTAEIEAKCKFFTGTPTVAFGAIDPSGTASVTATANVLYKCTNGTTPGSLAPTSGGLSRTMTDGGTNSLSYSLSFGSLTAGAGFSDGKQKTVVVTGTITQAQFADAVAASYSETVGMTITP